MDLFSTVGAATSLEFVVITLAGALLLDYRSASRQKRLWRSVKSLLETQEEPTLEPAQQRAA